MFIILKLNLFVLLFFWFIFNVLVYGFLDLINFDGIILLKLFWVLEVKVILIFLKFWGLKLFFFW